MTPLEQLFEERRAAWAEWHWYELAQYEQGITRTLKAMAESRRRSTAQRFRRLAERIERNFK